MRSRSKTAFISDRNGTRSQLALRPRPVLLCACTPVATQVKSMWLRWPRTGTRPVGSATMMPAGFDPPHQLRFFRDQAGALLGGLLVRGDQQGDRHAAGRARAATIAAATGPFMSVLPSP